MSTKLRYIDQGKGGTLALRAMCSVVTADKIMRTNGGMVHKECVRYVTLVKYCIRCSPKSECLFCYSAPDALTLQQGLAEQALSCSDAFAERIWSNALVILHFILVCAGRKSTPGRLHHHQHSQCPKKARRSSNSILFVHHHLTHPIVCAGTSHCILPPHCMCWN